MAKSAWPNVVNGASLVVYAEDGTTLITSAGVSIPVVTDYYEQLFRAAKLLDYDPLGVGGTPTSVLPEVLVDRALSAALADNATASVLADYTKGVRTDQLAAIVGTTGQTVRTTMHDALDTTREGAADFAWYAAADVALVTANGYSVLGSNAAGRWHMIRRGIITLPQIGCYGNHIADCAAKINAYFTAESQRADNVLFGMVTLHAPRAFESYRLSASINVPGGNRVTYRITGDGWFNASTAHFGSEEWEIGTPGALAGYPKGSVFRTDAGVTGLSSDSLVAYSRARLENVAFVGTGRTSAVGILAANPNFPIEWDNLGVFNYESGVYLVSSLSAKLNRCLRMAGCFYGLRCMSSTTRGVLVPAGNEGVTDILFLGLEAQGCNIGLYVWSATTLSFFGPLCQGCRVGVQIGGPAAVFDGTLSGVGSITFQGGHFEANGPDWIGSGAGSWNTADVAAATTGAITLSGVQNIDGVTGAADQRICVHMQADATKNGIYLQKSGAWVRAADDLYAGMYIPVAAGGSTHGDTTLWIDEQYGPKFIGPLSGGARTDGDALVFGTPLPGWHIAWEPTATSSIVAWNQCEFTGTNVSPLHPHGANYFNQSRVGNIDFTFEENSPCVVNGGRPNSVTGPSVAGAWRISDAQDHYPARLVVAPGATYTVDWLTYGTRHYLVAASGVTTTITLPAANKVPHNGFELHFELQKADDGTGQFAFSGLTRAGGFTEPATDSNSATRSVTLHAPYGAWIIKSFTAYSL